MNDMSDIVQDHIKGIYGLIPVSQRPALRLHLLGIIEQIEKEMEITPTTSEMRALYWTKISGANTSYSGEGVA